MKQFCSINMSLFLILLLVLFACSSNNLSEVTGIDNIKSFNDSIRKNFIIAHRGYRIGDTPENSLASLKAALNLGVYGVECDIRQTKDSILVISHDSSYGNKVIANTNYMELNRTKLSNNEDLPLLLTFLEVIKSESSKTILYLDIKKCDIKRLYTLISNCKMNKRVRYLVWTIGVGDQVINEDSTNMVSFFYDYLNPGQLLKKKYMGVSLSYPISIESILDYHNSHLTVNVWTVDKYDIIKYYLNQHCYVITDVPNFDYITN